MIFINLEAMLFAKQVEWNRHITIKEIADATGISRTTLHRISTNPTHNTSIDHIAKLCVYFGCEISALVSWKPNDT